MYQVACECKKTHSVSLADAGASLPCDCSRKVEVPALHKLRILASESVSRWDNALGCLMLAIVHFGRFTRGRTIVHGRDQFVVVPIRVCNECRHKLKDKNWLREALCKTPEYADLLDRYPEAGIALQR
jgi:hypothetical protein